MKNLAPAIIIAATTLIAACTESKTSGNATSNEEAKTCVADTFTMFEYSDTFALDTIGNGSPEMTIRISLPVLKESSERARKINHYICCATVECEPGNSIEQNIGNFVERCKAEYYALHSDYLDEKGINPSSPRFYHSYQIDGKMIESKKGTLCFEMDRIIYEGGAHGMEYKSYVNVDEATGNCIGKYDIIAEDADIVLCERLTATLARQLGVTTLEEIQEKGYLVGIEMWATENFHITDDSIYFHYDSYEIAPYALGSTTLALGLDEVKDIMK